MAAKLTPTDRKEFSKLVDNRTNALINAMNGDLLQNKEDLTREVLRSKGFDKNSDELNDDLVETQKDLTDKVSEVYAGEEQAIDVRIAEETEKLQQELREITNEFQKAKTELQLKIALVKDTIMGDSKKLEEKIANEKFPESVSKIEKLKQEKLAVENIESIVEKDINEKLAIIRKFRYRMESSIRDKCNRAKEALTIAESREEAKELLETIPTVEELVLACQGSEGINDLISKMSPKLALPLGDQNSESLKNATSKEDIIKTEKIEEVTHELEGKAEVVSIEPSESGPTENLTDDEEENEQEEQDEEETEEVEEEAAETTSGE